MKRIYLCGGMGAFGKDRFDEANKWRKCIKHDIEKFGEGKVKCCNPNDHFNFIEPDGYETEREIMEYDLHRVRHSDMLIVNFNDPKSIGSACEMAVAHELKIPIIGLCENGEEESLHPWLKEFCCRIFTNMIDLVYYVFQHYVSDD